MSDSQFKERAFDLEILERSNWRSRVNQLKRELRSTPEQSDSSEISTSASPRRLLKRPLVGTRSNNRSWDQRRPTPRSAPLSASLTFEAGSAAR